MALVNRFVLLESDVGGPRLWHERLALEHVRDDLYVVVTPDRDIYVEELGLMNDDLRNIRVRAAQGAIPPGVAAGQIYSLPVFAPSGSGEPCFGCFRSCRGWRSACRGCCSLPSGQLEVALRRNCSW